MATTMLRQLQLKVAQFPKLLAQKPNVNIAIIAKDGCRYASGGRKMVVSSSRFSWTRFKNDLHFYLMLGAVPLGSVIFYANFIVGEAELAEIPEGYEPKHWEYMKHPVHRWFAKYIYEDPVKTYEMNACKFVHTFESARMRARTARVKEMMQEKDDFRSWYFVPAVDPRASDRLAEHEKIQDEVERGTH